MESSPVTQEEVSQQIEEVPESDTKSETANAVIHSVPQKSKPLWISNITTSVKATDLKCHFSKSGKVVTAKIVTDGENCYGYIVLDSAEDANKCIKQFNDTYFDGRKITLSFLRPTKASDGPPKSPDPVSTSTSAEEFRRRRDEVKRRSRSRGDRRAARRRRSSSRRRDPLTVVYRNKSRERNGSSRRSGSCNDRYNSNWRLLAEQRKNREEMRRQMERESRTRELELKLEHERRKLKLERELFERERDELLRFDVQRRLVEKARLELMKERAKVEEERDKIRWRNLGDTGVHDITYKSPKNDKNIAVQSKILSLPQQATRECTKENRTRSKTSKDYDLSPPPPPNVGSDCKRRCSSQTESFIERKKERDHGYIPGKYSQKQVDKKYGYNRETKKYRGDDREQDQRMPSSTNINCYSSWTTTSSFGTSTPIPSSARVPAYYSRGFPASQEYSRCERASQSWNRKY